MSDATQTSTTTTTEGGKAALAAEPTKSGTDVQTFAPGTEAKQETVSALGGAPKEEGKQPEKPAGEAPKKEGTAPAELEVKLPEGFAPDEKLLGEFKGIAKDLGLKGEGAQKLVDVWAKAQQLGIDAQHAAAEKRHQEWSAALKADKEFGGAHLEANIQQAQRIVAKYGDAELKKMLNETGIGDHPALFRFVARIAKADAEDTIAGAAGKGVQKDTSEEALHRKLYPTMFPAES